MRIVYIGSILLAAAAGCEKTDPLYCPNHPGAPECTRIDGSMFPGDDMLFIDTLPSGDARTCFGAGAATVCLTSAPSSPVIFTNPGTLSTTSGVSTNPVCLATQPADWMAAGQPDACFIVGTSITLNPGADLSIVGNRPLVLLASTTITINAGIDAAGHGTTPGPGAPSSTCKAFASNPVGDTDGGGGGAGGSFMSQGGGGGSGDAQYAGGTPGAAESANPALLRAGCNGQKGGFGNSAGNGGEGGPGGGAVYLIAGDSITIASGITINVSGAGGNGPNRQGGGGGGGSGGMLLLHAPSITTTGAFLMANGGGGSSGGDDSSAGNPDPGNDPTSPTTVPAGGTGSDTAGNGGNGFYADGSPHDATGGTNGGTSNRGAGGGGGGKGWIQSNVALTATSSPTPVTIP